MQKRTVFTGIVVAVVLFLAVGGYISINNQFAAQSTAIDASWAEIENQMQRRADLIPNLVETVKGYTKHERETIEAVARARAQMAGAQTVKEKIAANNALEGALSRLLVVVERYPDLKANQNFRALQDELSGTENRLAVARMRYNESVRAYNTALRLFPRSVVARLQGYTPREYFEVAPEAKEAPRVKF